MNEKQNKSVIRYTIVGSVMMLVTVLITGILGISPKISGFKAAMENYFKIWLPSTLQTPLTYICLVIMLFAIALLVLLTVLAIIKRKYLRILPACGLFLALAFLPFLFLLTFPLAEQGKLGRLALYTLSGVTILNFAAIFIFGLALKDLFTSAIDLTKKLAGGEVNEEEEEEEEEVREQPVKEERIEEANEVNGLSEEEVRQIVEEYLEKHKEQLHTAPVVAAVAPKKEEEEEEDLDDEDEDEEEEEEEEVEVTDAEGNTIKIKRKKRVAFVNRLKRSEFDLRHKYYDLRDYIKWYGLNNRISIPGDSFSFKRKKYFFISIVGKHIKFYSAIDPVKYENSPIPVEQATAKKYAEVPCVLRIKSDLSYRRAKQLVDDVMSEAGFKKPEGDEPKETQHPEQD